MSLKSKRLALPGDEKLSLEAAIEFCAKASGTLAALADLHEVLAGKMQEHQAAQVEGYRVMSDDLMLLASGLDTLREEDGDRMLTIPLAARKVIARAAKWKRRDVGGVK